MRNGCLRRWVLYRKSSVFRSGFRILTYHRVVDHPRSSHDLKTEHFRLHMAYLSDHHPVLGLSELVERLIQGPLPEPGSVAVTFDDGYREAADTVATILTQYHIPATFFVITGVLDGNRRLKTKFADFMTWDDARALVSAGFTVGSHTVSHRSLGQIPSPEVEQELLISRNASEKNSALCRRSCPIRTGPSGMCRKTSQQQQNVRLTDALSQRSTI